MFIGKKLGKIFGGVLVLAPAVIIILGILDATNATSIYGANTAPLVDMIPGLDDAGISWIVFGILLELLILGGGFGVRKIYKRRRK